MEELIAQWRKWANEAEDVMPPLYAETLRDCASQLERLLNG